MQYILFDKNFLNNLVYHHNKALYTQIAKPHLK